MQPPSSTSGMSNVAVRRQKTETNSRSWADLPRDLLDVISNNLNVADYLSFGRVCRSWRLFYSESSKQRFMTSQSPLVVYTSARTKMCCYFYDINTQIRYKTKLPKSVSHFKFFLGVSSGYLIFVKDELGSYFLVINPVTGHQLEFPRIPKLPYIRARHTRTIFASTGSQGQDFLLVILSKIGKRLQFCTSRDKQWKVYSYSGKGWHILDIVVFDGRIFAITNDSQIGIFHFKSSELKLLKLKCAPPLSPYVKLVTSNEQLLIVQTIFYRIVQCRHEVYRTDFSRMEWVKVNNLGDQALFTGTCDVMCSKSINPTKWGGQSNCMYRLCCYDTCDICSLNGERIKTIRMPMVQGAWYFLHQSNSTDNVRDD